MCTLHTAQSASFLFHPRLRCVHQHRIASLLTCLLRPMRRRAVGSASLIPNETIIIIFEFIFKNKRFQIGAAQKFAEIYHVVNSSVSPLYLSLSRQPHGRLIHIILIRFGKNKLFCSFSVTISFDFCIFLFRQMRSGLFMCAFLLLMCSVYLGSRPIFAKLNKIKFI